MSGLGRSGAVSAGQEHTIVINCAGSHRYHAPSHSRGKAARGRGVGQSRLPAEIPLAVFFGEGLCIGLHTARDLPLVHCPGGQRVHRNQVNCAVPP